MNEKIEKKETAELLDWLRKNIHEKGRLYNSEEICEQVTGEGLNFSYFMDYVRNKYAEVYHGQ